LRKRRAKQRRGGIAKNARLIDVLTTREAEVLHLLAHGKSNSEIARILKVKSSTVGKHLERVYPKLGVENRTAAASILLREQRWTQPTTKTQIRVMGKSECS
jgi:DNA-binding NarL/FixJ family response regulator